jgi:phage FluMu protein gp41
MYQVTLHDGLKVGDHTYRQVTLRSLTAGQLMDAQRAAEQVYPVGSDFVVMASPVQMAAEVLAKKVQKIDDYPGPLTLQQLRSLSATDLDLLRAGADDLDTAIAASVAARGRPAAAGATGAAAAN